MGLKELVQKHASEIAEALTGEGWHMPEDCEHPNCADDSEVEVLTDAIRSLHTQAHNGPQDSLELENCRVEPYRSVSL